MTPSLLVAGVDAKLAIVSMFVAFTPTVYVRVYLLQKYTKCVPGSAGAWSDAEARWDRSCPEHFCWTLRPEAF